MTRSFPARDAAPLAGALTVVTLAAVHADRLDYPLAPERHHRPGLRRGEGRRSLPLAGERRRPGDGDVGGGGERAHPLVPRRPAARGDQGAAHPPRRLPARLRPREAGHALLLLHGTRASRTSPCSTCARGSRGRSACSSTPTRSARTARWPSSAPPPTQDGALLGYSLSRSGSDRQEILRPRRRHRQGPAGQGAVGEVQRHHLDARTSRASTTRASRSRGSVPAGDENYSAQVYFHRLGEAQDKDTLVFEQPDRKEIVWSASLTLDGRYLVLTGFEGSSDKSEVWVADRQSGGQAGAPLQGLRGRLRVRGRRRRAPLLHDRQGRAPLAPRVRRHGQRRPRRGAGAGRRQGAPGGGRRSSTSRSW